MKICVFVLISCLLLSCGGVDEATVPSDNKPPPIKSSIYTNSEANRLVMTVGNIAESVTEISQLVESEFIYFFYDKVKSSSRPCINNGKVLRLFTNNSDKGQVTFDFKNCEIAPYNDAI